MNRPSIKWSIEIHFVQDQIQPHFLRGEDVGRPQKKHKPEEIVSKLRQVNVLLSQGKSVGEAVRTIGVTQFTYYRWRKEFGGLKGDQVKRLKELEKRMIGYARLCRI